MFDKIIFGIVASVIVVVFLTVFSFIGASGYLIYKCYASGNPNDQACFMISDRHEIGIRNRQ